MRAVVVLLLLSFVTAAEASRARDVDDLDLTDVWATSDRSPTSSMVPRSPSFFVHIGSDAPTGAPTFWRNDGTAIPIAMVTAIASYPEWNLARVELDIQEGEILVRLPGSDDVVVRYMIHPALRLRTRRVEILASSMTVLIDSDAAFFMMDGGELVRNTGSIHVSVGESLRLVALYADGMRELIYDGIPVADDPIVTVAARPVPREKFHPLPVILAWLLLGAVALWRRRILREQPRDSVAP